MDNYIKIPRGLNSKCVLLSMKKDAARSWWFLLGDNSTVLAIDYIPENYPDFEIVTFKTVKEALDRKDEMTQNEGWEIVKDFLNELN